MTSQRFERHAPFILPAFTKEHCLSIFLNGLGLLVACSLCIPVRTMAAVSTEEFAR